MIPVEQVEAWISPLQERIDELTDLAEQHRFISHRALSENCGRHVNLVQNVENGPNALYIKTYSLRF
jgi:hypothetical protein